MPRVKNPEYRQFIETGLINTIPDRDFKAMLDKLESPHKMEAQALAAMVYLSGRRPIEVVDLKVKDIAIKPAHIRIVFRTAKKGRATLVHLPHTSKITPYFSRHFERLPTTWKDWFVFHSFRSKAKRTVKIKNKRTGEIKEKQYLAQANKLHHHFTKWFGVPTYFLRHNRFSKMSEAGADLQEITYAKGSNDPRSAMRYVHLSAKRAEAMKKYYEDQEELKG